MNHAKATATRREFLALGGGCLGLAALGDASGADPAPVTGLVVGERRAAEVGKRVLADGGNAVDAAVAAALVAAIVSPANCGIGGYGGHMTIGWPDGRVTSLDFNSAAPAAAREDMFPRDDRGRVRGAIDAYGWLAAGVPGTLAGLQLAIDRYGSRGFSALVEPAIGFARNGFALDTGQARAIRVSAAQFQRDPASARIYCPGGEPLSAGQTLRNPDLATLLERLARDNSVAAFYHGDIARVIANEFRRHEGLVTADDLAKYEAREVAPLKFDWCGESLYTATVTAGGLSVLQAMTTLKALRFEACDLADSSNAQAFIEAMRIAWHDRLTRLGDAADSDVTAQLLSAGYAEESAERVRQAIREKRPVPGATDGRPAGGTIHLSAADQQGCMVALTLTHGGGFGARVTVAGLGLTLGHGMSRFTMQPGHPNAPGPFRRPLNNMCPMIVCRGAQPVVAMGATGGRRIPNTMYSVLVKLVAQRAPLAKAFAAPRFQNEGDTVLQLGKGWPDADVEYLKRVGYSIQDGAGANLNAIARDSATGELAQVP